MEEHIVPATPLALMGLHLHHLRLYPCPVSPPLVHRESHRDNGPLRKKRLEWLTGTLSPRGFCNLPPGCLCCIHHHGSCDLGTVDTVSTGLSSGRCSGYLPNCCPQHSLLARGDSQTRAALRKKELNVSCWNSLTTGFYL